MKTNDIVKRAQQIADLENSSFISWRENVNLLNEAYRDIYQKAINANVKHWLVDWNLTDGERVEGNAVRYKLPDDFYTLYSINEKHTNRNLFKKSTNETSSGFKYDIENGYLIVYGANKEIVAKYYKVPQKLYYKGEEIETGYTYYNSYMYDCFDKYIVKYDPSAGTVAIYDIKAETTTTLSGLQTNGYIVAVKQGIMIATSLYAKQYNLYGYDGTLLLNNVSGPWFLDEKKRLVTYVVSNNVGLFLDYVSGAPIKAVTLPIADISNLYNVFAYVDFEENIAKWSDNAGSITECNLDTLETKVYAQPYGSDAYFNMNIIFDKWFIRMTDTYGSTESLKLCLPIIKNGKAEKEGSDIIGINKKDYKTSYGYVDTDGVLHSMFDDMELDTPNSFFDAMLSYSLALQYKAKQNSVNEGLSVLYQNAENQFFNSLPQDSYSYTRIQNVY